MYSRKSVGPKLETRGTRHSREDFPSRTFEAITEKRTNKANYLTWNFVTSWRRPASQVLSKALDISIATTRVAPDLLKVLAILSDTTVKRSAADQEDLKPYWK